MRNADPNTKCAWNSSWMFAWVKALHSNIPPHLTPASSEWSLAQLCPSRPALGHWRRLGSVPAQCRLSSRMGPSPTPYLKPALMMGKCSAHSNNTDHIIAVHSHSQHDVTSNELHHFTKMLEYMVKRSANHIMTHRLHDEREGSHYLSL